MGVVNGSAQQSVGTAAAVGAEKVRGIEGLGGIQTLMAGIPLSDNAEGDPQQFVVNRSQDHRRVSKVASAKAQRHARQLFRRDRVRQATATVNTRNSRQERLASQAITQSLTAPKVAASGFAAPPTADPHKNPGVFAREAQLRLQFLKSQQPMLNMRYAQDRIRSLKVEANQATRRSEQRALQQERMAWEREVRRPNADAAQQIEAIRAQLGSIPFGPERDALEAKIVGLKQAPSLIECRRKACDEEMEFLARAIEAIPRG